VTGVLPFRLFLPAAIVALASATLRVQAAPVTQETPAPGVESAVPMPALGMDPPPAPASGPTGAGTITTPSGPGPSPDGAAGAMLEDLRRRAGIGAPGGATAASSTSAGGDRSRAGKAGAVEAAAELDPELKEALKEARDWAKDALPGADTPVNQALHSESGPPGRTGADPGSEDGEGDTDAALRRAEMAAAQPDAPPRETTVPGGIPIVAELIQWVRDLLLSPVTWLALGLALLLKVTLAMVAMRSRRRVHRRRAGRQAAAAPSADEALPPAANTASDPGPIERPRRTSRHGQRHRRQQR
jgi:hypothetical protein